LTNASPLKQPSAWLPLAMSLAAVGLVVGHAAVDGVVHTDSQSANAKR